MSKKGLRVRVPTNIVRNSDIQIGNGEFQLYVKLCFLRFRNYEDDKITLDHKKLMCNLGINDSRTFKKRLSNLHTSKLINNEIVKLPRSGCIDIEFNSKMLDSKHFTLMNAKVFDYIDKIDEHAFRLLFYYKSHINKDDKDKDRSFCYVGYDTLVKNLKMSKKTIASANELLKKEKLIKVEKHKLCTDYQYDENDELVYDRYNNHYKINNEMF
ncbi:hypothetical protein [Metabacillus sp. Hm71]|uniref:hypothetical protein n=1 Tax=Metabacillus sp. Hm71 TaxID=3450743 RepID=UPI003F43297F